jgi:hypothetical protein
MDTQTERAETFAGLTMVWQWRGVAMARCARTVLLAARGRERASKHAGGLCAHPLLVAASAPATCLASDMSPLSLSVIFDQMQHNTQDTVLQTVWF